MKTASNSSFIQMLVVDVDSQKKTVKSNIVKDNDNENANCKEITITEVITGMSHIFWNNETVRKIKSAT